MPYIAIYYLRMLIAYYTCLRTVHSSLERMHPRMRPYMQAYTRTGQQRQFSDLICCRMSRPLAYSIRCLRLLIGRRCYSI